MGFEHERLFLFLQLKLFSVLLFLSDLFSQTGLKFFNVMIVFGAFEHFYMVIDSLIKVYVIHQFLGLSLVVFQTVLISSSGVLQSGQMVLFVRIPGSDGHVFS